MRKGFLLKTFGSLSKRSGTVLALAAATAGIVTAYVSLTHYLIGVPENAEALPAGARLTQVLSDLALVLLFGGLYAAVFTRIGADVAGKIWRTGSSSEALRRFVPLWTILLLLQYALLQVMQMLDRMNAHAVLGVMVTLVFLYSIAYVPVGAALMYRGVPGRESLADTFAPFGRYPGQTALILLAGLFALALVLEAQPPMDAPLLMRLQVLVPLEALLSLIALVRFTWTFHVFRHDQATYVPDTGFDL